MANIYTPLKIFHYKEKLDSLVPAKGTILPPLHIRIKPTNICNHRCGYCAYRTSTLQLGQNMAKSDSIPRDKMLEIVEDIIEMQVKAVTFSGGGEPLVYPHLRDVLQRLSASTVRFATLTNGAALHGEVAELFAFHGTWVRISMDGYDAASYAKYRRVGEDEFGKVLNNIKEFKQSGGDCLLGVSFIVDAVNYPHVYAMISRLHDLGVDSVKVSPCIVDNAGSKNNEYHSSFFAKVSEQVERSIRDFSSPSFEIFDAYHQLDHTFDKEYPWCPYCQILPVIGADQNVYSCQDKAYNLETGRLGSIKRTRFKDFWFKDKEKFFVINPRRDCCHHCVANKKNKLILDYLDVDMNHVGFV